ncbi:cysteine synthase family protein [uncultured Nisaea sp.]|uniref:PLP-dependent cysteine synthase family protein n=1 Tax=uncultured Nisaea sp. TaxID=538215 RepID=UPI0030EC56C3|tara:strand:- start:99 stop:1052 length:954 start_codon:yes stop_codon:yes gene_type:complete
MNVVESSILSRIGDTPLVELKAIVPEGSARVFLKIESENPTGSMKDRMALAMIEAAERDGRLRPGAPVVEYTGGSTGISLAMVCAVKGHLLHIVSSDAFSIEKRRHMQALGADLTIVPSDGGRMDAALTHAMIAEADRIRGETGACWTDQLKNTDQLAAYHAMGAEIWQQTDGVVDAFVQATGTAASVRGISAFLKSKCSSIRTIAVEPSESAVLSGGKTGAHRIEGVGAGFVVPLWDPELIDGIATVSTGEAMAMSRRLAREEGIFAGTSTGSNVIAALRVAADLGSNGSVVTIMCDSGVKYLSTELYNRTGEADE